MNMMIQARKPSTVLQEGDAEQISYSKIVDMLVVVFENIWTKHLNSNRASPI
jgi:hypothetical protein